MTLIDAVFDKAGVDRSRSSGSRSVLYADRPLLLGLTVSHPRGHVAAILFAIPLTRSERPAIERKMAAIHLGHGGAAGVIGESASRGGYSRRGYSGLPPALWAGLTFLLTCVLLGFAILGTLMVRGRSREIWLGASLFGWGYLILAFGLHPFQATCPYLVTGQFLSAIRPWFPPSVSGLPATEDRADPANIRILEDAGAADPDAVPERDFIGRRPQVHQEGDNRC